MSAIAGIYQLNNEQISDDHIANMMNSLQRYPANDVQVWHQQNTFLGCHAQWITPESVGELLPYYDSERKLSITADAIIDNREELFEKLQIDKSRQRFVPDSQLILLAYFKWGEDAPKYLIGDFAFMIWDQRNGKLFGARDFSGGRTLYYYHNQKQFAFCTIMEPLFTLPYIKKKLNEQWLAEFLAISSVIETVDTNITAYQDIKQIPPSHSISINDKGVKLSRYCTITSGKKLKLKDNREYEEAFQQVFQEAVRSRLRCNRQVGSHLSGGLDSGAVVGFASRILQTKNDSLYTFSYIPPKDFIDFTPKYRVANESSFINETVQYVGGLNHHFMDFKGVSPLSEVDFFLNTLETPYKFIENSIWLKGIFEKAYKEDLGVLLNGGRGNLTISWGSAMEYYALLLKRIKWIRFFQELDYYSQNMDVSKTKTIQYVGKMAFPIVNQILPTFKKYQSKTMISKELAAKTEVYKKLKTHGINEQSSTLPNIFKERKRHFHELFHWNATNTLGTKLSLKYSLWKRDPTNDLRLIRFCLSLPEEQYVQNGMDRSLIRRATKNLLPDKVRLNLKYRGVQGVDWVHRMIPNWDLFVEELEELRADKEVFNYLNESVVETAINKVKEGPETEHAINPDYRIALRSLIVYRFLKKFN
ncbi:lasso peptide isopeptide bond-forming cyclase [Sediminibacillus massiliensis]|uniref:lasso peptide isopeptide bond-forming cyclase n=1 Tax=Sediminibacillus massiliensis TaxID=1926277 RepID=UPI0009884A56|nr:lasso peptide isopeptide bond-forming cyclase [Sediminibacillus massiliensis]